jgi:2-polyprenyl-3-methyl-5-hydroxy-6-metoxy-1,4-benzoquinol methylase
MGNYDAQTINARNPLARFAHRNRIRRSLALALARMGSGKLLDYGCGSGVFVSEVVARHPGCAVGYEPYMTERARASLPIFDSRAEVELYGPYNLITLFETIEHLSEEELGSFLELAERVLTPRGGILISAPIEIGPALIFKDLNRFALRRKQSEHRLLELLKAAILGIPARRAENLKTSHRGFDFRRVRNDLRTRGWETEVVAYGPLPSGSWYGNSQVYLWCYRPSADGNSAMACKDS